MTKSFIMYEKHQNELSELWVHNIIARKLTIKNISRQMKYNLNAYIEEKESIAHTIIFLFLGMMQLFFYTLGALIVKLRYRDMPSLQD